MGGRNDSNGEHSVALSNPLEEDRDPGHRNLIVPRADLVVHTGSRRVPRTVLICMEGGLGMKYNIRKRSTMNLVETENVWVP